ncbi:hypothetical protein GCM10020331_051800 [Ectobacillus funiculus]
MLSRYWKDYTVSMIFLIVTSSVSNAFAEKELWIEKVSSFLLENIIWFFSHRKDMIVGDLLFDDAPHNLTAFFLNRPDCSSDGLSL